MTAKDTAVYWVEYVLRHHGASHLHYSGADLNFMQFNSIDVILFLAILTFVFFQVFKFFVKKIFCGEVAKEEKLKQKKN